MPKDMEGRDQHDQALLVTDGGQRGGRVLTAFEWASARVRTALLCLAALLYARAAAADVLLPTLMVVHGELLLLAPAILLIESIIAIRVLRLSVPRSVLVVAGANLASALVGIPVAFLILLALRGGYGFVNGSDRALSWLAPSGLRFVMGANHRELLTQMWLCVPFCLASIWVEFYVAKWLARAEAKAECLRWSWQANLASYSMILGLLTILLIASNVYRRQGYY